MVLFKKLLKFTVTSLAFYMCIIFFVWGYLEFDVTFTHDIKIKQFASMFFSTMVPIIISAIWLVAYSMDVCKIGLSA